MSQADLRFHPPRSFGPRQAAVLKNLRHLVEAARAGSLHKASDRLGTVQSALSRRISEVEQALGGGVFHRTASGVVVTEAGQGLCEDADRLLDDLDRMIRRFELIDAGQVTPLRVAFNGPAMMHAALPLALQSYREAHPRVDLRLSPLLSQAQFPLIESGLIDVGVAFDLGAPARGLQSRPLAMDRLALAIPAHHPLALKADLQITDLEGMDVMGMERPASDRLADLAAQQLRTAGVAIRTVFTAGTTETALSLVAGGLGMAFINRSQKGWEPPSVVIRDVTGFDVPLPLRLFWSRSVQTPPLAGFVDAVAAAFADRPQFNPQHWPPIATHRKRFGVIYCGNAKRTVG